MNKKSLLLFLLSSTLLFSCSQNKENPEPPYEPYDDKPIVYNITYETSLFKENGEAFNLNQTLTYKDTFFDNSGLIYNQELAEASLATTITHYLKDDVTKLITALGFKDLYTSPDYDKKLNKDSVCYIFGHKRLGNDTVFYIGISGFEYGPAWENNFIWDKTGNASGFQSASNKVKDAFMKYYKGHKTKTNKLWVTGYSRTAAVAGIMLEELLDSNFIEEERVYSYLFETPAVMTKETVKEHPSIRNIINSRDFIVNAFPSKFGFIRPGVEIDIYLDNIDEIAIAYDSRLVCSTFTPVEGKYADEKELTVHLVSDVLAKDTDPEDPEVHNMATREKYADYYQDAFGFIAGSIFSLKKETLNNIKDDFMALDISGKLALLSGDGLYNFLKEELDKNSEQYDDTRLHNTCATLITYLTEINPGILSLISYTGLVDSALRIFQFHSFEVEMPLLIAYGKK